MQGIALSFTPLKTTRYYDQPLFSRKYESADCNEKDNNNSKSSAATCVKLNIYIKMILED